MKPLKYQVEALRKNGYALDAARMKVAHDVILLAMHRCGFKQSSTVKGGVVMSHMTNDIRRTTMDMDIAFIKRSISEVSIRRFVKKLNCLPGVNVSVFGTITELNHEDYRGRRVFLDVRDASIAKPLRMKMDIGVHTHTELRQVDYRFDLTNDPEPAELKANSPEQILVEKLLSLLRFGQLSRRPKDVFDIYYLREKVDLMTLCEYVGGLIYENRKCRVNGKAELLEALRVTFSSKMFLRRLAKADANWLELEPSVVTETVLGFLSEVL